MTGSINTPRRKFLQYSGLTMAGLYAFPSWLQAMEKKTLAVATANFIPDVEFELVARPAAFGVLPGTLTNVQKYFGKLIKGPANTLTDIPGSYLGPVLRLQKGQKVRVHFRHELEETCITHWHGLHVPHLADGHPMFAIEKGETWVYEFEVMNRAGTYFYHPHTHELTGKQVYMGLSGMIIVEDEEEKKLGLPSGEYELPVAIQDRSFDADNQLIYVTHPMQRMMGFHGDRIFVNGKPNAEFEVASRAYRLRIANGSNSRIYKLAWDDGTPITVLGVDGGLLESPLNKPYVMMGPGERIDVWADFSGREVGTELVMRSKPFSGALPPMHEKMMTMMGKDGDGKGMAGMDHGSTPTDNKPKAEAKGGMGMMGMMGDGMHMMKGGMGGMDHGGQANTKPKAEVKEGMDHGAGGSMGMMGGKGGGMDMKNMACMTLPQGSDYPIFKVRVTRKASDSPKLPEKLCTINRYAVKDTANADKPIPIGIKEGMGSMLLNGRPFKMDDVQEFEKIKVNSLQYLEIFHDHDMGDGAAAKSGHADDKGEKPAGASSMAGMDHGKAPTGDKPAETKGDMDHSAGGGGMGMMGGMGGGMMGGMSMSMAHPIHIHGQQFQILSRSQDMKEEGYDTVKDGFIDAGWKDVVLVMPGERIRIVKPFDNFTGLFTYHCHNLEHEDMGMMRDFLII